MWSAIRWLVLRIAAIRWLFKLGGLAFLLPLREHVPDAWAGIYLTSKGVKELPGETGPIRIVRIGLLETEVTGDGTPHVWRNRVALKRYLASTAAQALTNREPVKLTRRRLKLQRRSRLQSSSLSSTRSSSRSSACAL